MVPDIAIKLFINIIHPKINSKRLVNKIRWSINFTSTDHIILFVGYKTMDTYSFAISLII